LYRLSPPRPDGLVTSLTKFPDGYVAEPEISWDGRSVLFAAVANMTLGGTSGGSASTAAAYSN